VKESLNRVQGQTENFKSVLASKLAEYAPEVVSDGEIDFEKLKELLASDIADDRERYGLFWPGKKRALRAAQEPTSATLKPDFQESKNWHETKNIFIEGDNLEVLKILQKYYHGRVKLIYIDPPYNTGQDFVYPDNYKEGLASYLEWSKQVNEEGKKLSTNSETEGRFHSNWLNMMYPRIKLARNLLTDDGAIFVSISEHEVDNLRKILNEIFGESNFVGQIAVAKGTTTGQDAHDIGSSIDFLLVFARSKEQFVPNGLPMDEKDIARFNLEDSKGKYSVLQFRKTGTNDRREDRPNLYYSITAPDGSEIFPIGPGGYESCWRTARPQFEEWLSQDMIEWKQDEGGSFRPYVKYYLEGRTKQVSNYWDDIEGNKKASLTIKELLGRDVFTNPKPVGLLRKILAIGTEKESLILDFFAGAATTAHAVMEANHADGGQRRFIMVQLPEPTPENSEARKQGFLNIASISRKRIIAAGERIEKMNDGLFDSSDQDFGFRAYSLVDSNFQKWQVTSDIATDALTQHILDLREIASDESSSDDLLTEILLKQGYSLTEETENIKIGNLQLKSIAKNLILAYLDEQKPSMESLREVIATKPVRFVILEDSFQGDDELKTNLVQECKSNAVELWTA
jgi:adenine-specific DNA-methyltransferase